MNMPKQLGRGKGPADFLAELSRKSEPFSQIELNTLKDAARHGARVYEQVYFELRPAHQRSLLASGKPAQKQSLSA